MDSSDPNARHELAMRMAELARTTAAPSTLEQILDGVTAAAVELMPGADLAGVLLVKKGGAFESLGRNRQSGRKARQAAARVQRRTLR